MIEINFNLVKDIEHLTDKAKYHLGQYVIDSFNKLIDSDDYLTQISSMSIAEKCYVEHQLAMMMRECPTTSSCGDIGVKIHNLANSGLLTPRDYNNTVKQHDFNYKEDGILGIIGSIKDYNELCGPEFEQADHYQGDL